jgi:hypothetical protein
VVQVGDFCAMIADEVQQLRSRTGGSANHS